MGNKAVRRLGSGVIGCVALLGLLSGVGGPAVSAGASGAPAQLVTLTIPAPAGQIPSQWLGYPGPPRANVLLPAGYDSSKQYPLLVLLGGLAQNYDSYAADGIVSQLESLGLNAIVVMPEGASGWYTDWWNNGQRGGPSWETYELDTVIPTVLARYPILPQRQYHAIAGFSMGGLGATYLAGRLPGFFGSVGTLSGFVDPQYFAPITQAGMGLTSFANLAGDDDLNPVYGPPYGFYASGHNPTLLTMNLQQTRVFESTGTGVPSSAGLSYLPTGFDQAAAIAEGSVLEAPIIFPMNQLFHGELMANHVDVTYQVHTGGHDIPDFLQEMQAYLAWNPFAAVAGNPALWRNDTVASSGQLWDISYRFVQPPTKVVQFQQFGNTVSVSAAGTAVTITTSKGCTITTSTPARLTLSSQDCD